jgi:hypothetical protein
MSDFRIQTNSIISSDGTGSPSFLKGYTVSNNAPTELQSSVNISGITTVGFLTATNMVVGVVTATRFDGDGSGLTNVPEVTNGKAYAFHTLLADPPLRA